LLQAEIRKDPSKWEFPDVEFGTDLSTEHERWLAEKKFRTATFVYDYPKSIKAFYMRDNDGCAPGKETVAAMDLLVPGIGELIGGLAQCDTAVGVAVDDGPVIGKITPCRTQRLVQRAGMLSTPGARALRHLKLCRAFVCAYSP